VADVVGCTPTFVRDVWAGDYNKRATETQENIEVATALLQDGANKLIEEVKRIIA
jgi:membrane carboxypeptidase/penicillin-binding protein PbpC